MEVGIEKMKFYKKLINHFFIVCMNLISYINKKIILLRNDNIKFGNNVFIGKQVKIKTTDGGQIIIDDNVTVEDNVYIYAQYGTIHIQRNTFIGYGTHIVAKKCIFIGEDNLIAAYVVIRDSNHGIDANNKINLQKDISKEIKIGNDVWIGTHSVITSGTTISNGVVIGANSVVTKNIDEYDVVGGVPAKMIKKRI